MQKTRNRRKVLARKKHLLPVWHKHPFVIPVVTFFILFFSSCAAFVAFNGVAGGADDAKVVRLSIDGQSRTVPTRAKTVEDLLKRADVELRENDVVEPALDSAILGDDFRVNIYRAKPVTVVDEKGQRVSTKIAEASPDLIAKKAGMTVHPEDKVYFAPPDEALSEGVIGAKVTVDRATPVNINLYGNSIPARTHAVTVEQVLAEKGIKILEGDTLQPERNAPVTENTQIFVVRVGKQIVSVEEELPAPVQKVSDPNLRVGTAEVKEPGAPGKKVVTYEVELRNDQEVSRRPIQEVVAMQPIRRVIAEGTKVVVSNPSANVQIGQQLAAERGWTGNQWYCLYQLWQKESGWNHLASNRSSGAYGIPQALPGSKMGRVGADWQTNPATQIRWGLGYISGSYGTPCGAWQTSQSRGWY